MKVRLERWCPKKGLPLRVINPKYSSIGGFTKYGFARGWGIDVSAAYWIARQGVLGWRSLDQDVGRNKQDKQDIKGHTSLSRSREGLCECIMVQRKRPSEDEGVGERLAGTTFGGVIGMKNLSTDVERAFRRKKPRDKGKVNEASEEEKAWNLLYEHTPFSPPRTGWRDKGRVIEEAETSERASASDGSSEKASPFGRRAIAQQNNWGS